MVFLASLMSFQLTEEVMNDSQSKNYHVFIWENRNIKPQNQVRKWDLFFGTILELYINQTQTKTKTK